MKRLVTGLPAMAQRRVEVGARTIVDVVLLVSEIVEELGIAARPEFELTCNLPPEPVMLAVDADGMRRGIRNLLLNAIEAMPQGGTLTVSTRPYRTSWIRIEISDTGLGIPEEHIEEIFTPFYSTKKGGTGLGLSYARGVIADANGRIRVKSTEGKGSTFRVDFPLHKRKA